MGAPGAKVRVPDVPEATSTLGEVGPATGASRIDPAGADTVDFGVPGTEVDLREAKSESDRSSPAASLFNIFLISIHSLRPVQASSPPPSV
jgi:hypothetical protein